MKTSEKIDALLTALHLARTSFREVQKSGKNSHFGNEYSTITDIFDACKEALYEQGIHVIYTTRCDGNLNYLSTMMFHADSGQYIESETSIGSVSAKSQEVGSAITYMRRYQIQAMLNLEADGETDDDGNSASGNHIRDGRKVKENVPDMTYAGPPYRIFNADKLATRTLETVKVWGAEMRKQLAATSDPRFHAANAPEIDRIRAEINSHQDLKPNEKSKLIAAIDDLPVVRPDAG